MDESNVADLKRRLRAKDPQARVEAASLIVLALIAAAEKRRREGKD
jgi:hypothetical protein